MKSRALLAGCLVWAMSVLALRAGPESYSQVLKDREAVLMQILAARESRKQVGSATAESVLAARIDLLRFRRDTAASRQEKLEQQQRIVDLRRSWLADTEAREKVGGQGIDDVLIAKEQMLAAMQKLEEMKLEEPPSAR